MRQLGEIPRLKDEQRLPHRAIAGYARGLLPPRPACRLDMADAGVGQPHFEAPLFRRVSVLAGAPRPSPGMA